MPCGRKISRCWKRASASTRRAVPSVKMVRRYSPTYGLLARFEQAALVLSAVQRPKAGLRENGRADEEPDFCVDQSRVSNGHPRRLADAVARAWPPPGLRSLRQHDDDRGLRASGPGRARAVPRHDAMFPLWALLVRLQRFESRAA